MSHRVTISPVRKRERDDDLGCDVTRIIGYRLVCTCGQKSRVKTRVAELREWDHLQARR